MEKYSSSIAWLIYKNVNCADAIMAVAEFFKMILYLLKLLNSSNTFVDCAEK